MRFTMTIRAYKNTFLGFLSSFVNASRSDMKLLLGWVSVVEMKVSEISVVSADTALSAVFGNQKLFDVLPLYTRLFRDQFAVLPIVFSLIFRGTQFTVVAATTFGRTVFIKFLEGFRQLTGFTFSFVHIVNT
jgi:hypothetical protein